MFYVKVCCLLGAADPEFVCPSCSWKIAFVVHWIFRDKVGCYSGVSLSRRYAGTGSCYDLPTLLLYGTQLPQICS